MRRLLGDFLANITHEFRTPLAALAASIELLLDQLPSLSLEETRELVNNLYLGSLGLQTLIDNLLEGASIEAGRFQVRPQPADLSQIVRDALRTMQPLLDKYSQHLRLDLPEGLPAVQADARRTGQVLINLLSNAIKWSPAGAEISVQVEPGPQSIKISVGDEGAGLSAEQKQDLFRRFAYLTVQEHRAEAGAGLGLSVVKAIVTAQQGEVGACDRPGGGVIFWFTIPVAEASA
jgi:K+-sensing histidine kinase KdpD